jgi:hypothetical protein
MRRIVLALGIGIMATALSAGVAQAAPAEKPQTGTAQRTDGLGGSRHWYAVAGVRRTDASAKELMAKLDAKGFKDFEIRTRDVRHGLHRVRRLEVERMFPGRQDARAEVKRLRDADFAGRVVRQRG